MAWNMLEVDDALRGMPEKAVAKYVVEPSPDVPPFMALAELSRRKTMRAEHQAKPQSEGALDVVECRPEPNAVGRPLRPTQKLVGRLD